MSARPVITPGKGRIGEDEEMRTITYRGYKIELHSNGSRYVILQNSPQSPPKFKRTYEAQDFIDKLVDAPVAGPPKRSEKE